VTAVDLGGSPYFAQKDERVQVAVGNFNEMMFEKQFDCVWASHILEHQPDVQSFLNHVSAVLKEGGVLAITVPPLKHQIVAGHVSLWNAGLLLYRLVLARFDCRDARVLQYDYNISVILHKRTITLPDGISFDAGDLRKLRQFFPQALNWQSNPIDDSFNGDIQSLNWYGTATR
jgi:SAM-dependent methyltransferase